MYKAICSLLQKLGLGSKNPNPLPQFQPLLDKIAPRDLGFEVVIEGDPLHPHKFLRIEWDRERFGADFLNPDPDPGTPVAFPMATYRDLFRCSCGAEGIKSVRALI